MGTAKLVASLSEQESVRSGLLGDCYRVEQELGHGGMARVYRVVDERSGQRFALKKLVAAAERPAAAQAMFEHEFHTLAGLAHPRIVRVVGYGLDEEGPFYTMELLEGSDARALAKSRQLSAAQVCLLLRDAASALALIHSRRMLHRDLSPRNLFCTSGGRAKLIDFGTLAPMGVQAKIAGTPPFVPPEAVYMQALDARSDIYALGALGYYLLTRRNAYQARQMRDLRLLWQRRPKKVIALRPDIPQALSDLVMSMLSLDPRGRPATAAEVCDRLTAIGGLPIEDESKLAQAFLMTPTLVGRDDQRAFVRARLLRTLRGRGNTFAILGAAGLGRSRMLGSVVLDAKLMGALTVSIDTATVQPTSLGLATAIAESLLEVLPSVPIMQREVASALAELSPSLERLFGKPMAADPTPAARKRRLESAWMALIQTVSRDQPLVLAVDDVQRSDGPSLALLGSLAMGTQHNRLLLVVSCDADVLAHASPALLQLMKPDNRIVLSPLSPPQTRELLGSLFGAVPGLDEASRYLHEISEGSPRVCLQYAQYLVDQDLAHYEAGSWRLPERLREHGLPATLAAMLERRVSVLGADASALALGLALARDETRALWQPEYTVHVEDLPRLLDPEAASTSRTFAALDELVRAGFVERREHDYVLTQSAIADALLRVADDGARKRIQLRLAEIFRGEPYGDPMVAIRHLQAAGDYARAHETYLNMAEDALRGLVDWTFGAMRLSISANCAQRQLAWWQQQENRAPREGTILRRLLITNASVYDWSLARCGDAQLDQLFLDLGFAHWNATDPALSTSDRLAVCMQLAKEEHSRRAPAERSSSPNIASRELPACAIPLSGALVNSHDVERTRSLATKFAFLRSLSPLHELVADVCDLAVDRVTGHALDDRPLSCLQRLYGAAEFPDVLRLGAVAVYMHVQALEDARSGRKRALELMDGLAYSVGDSMFIVVHGRWLAHVFRGQAAQAAKFREQLGLMTADDAWRRRAYLFVEAQAQALVGDLVGLKATAEAIAELTDQFPGWRPWLMYCHAKMHQLRGELADAQLAFERALEAAQAGEHRAYVVAAPAYAEILLAQDQTALALAQAEQIVNAVHAHGLDRHALVAAERVRALALSARGEHENARESLRGAFATARKLEYDGLPLAVLYEAQARITLASGELPDALKALGSLRELLEHAEAPALVTAYELLREDSGHKVRGSDPSALSTPDYSALVEIAPLDGKALARELAATDSAQEDAREHETLGETQVSPSLSQPPSASRATFAAPSKALAEARALINSGTDRHQRAREALAVLLTDSGCRAGHLLLLDVGGVVGAASIGLATPDDELLTWAQRFFELEVGALKDLVVSTSEHAIVSTPPPAPCGESDTPLMPLVLSDVADGHAMFVGLALLEPSSGPMRQPRGDIVRAVSRILLDAGDTVPFAVDG